MGIPTSHVLVRVQYPDWAQPDCCGGVNIFPKFNNASYGILFWKWPKKDIFWQLIRNMTSGGPSWQSGPISQIQPNQVLQSHCTTWPSSSHRWSNLQHLSNVKHRWSYDNIIMQWSAFEISTNTTELQKSLSLPRLFLSILSFICYFFLFLYFFLLPRPFINIQLEEGKCFAMFLTRATSDTDTNPTLENIISFLLLWQHHIISTNIVSHDNLIFICIG